MQYLGAFSKMTEWSWLISKDSLMNEFQEFIHWFKWINDLDSFSITVIQLYAPTTNAEGAEVERFYDDLQELLKPTPKRCPFHHSGLECKSRKSREIWSNRNVLPWSTKWSRAKTNRFLPREHTGHSKDPLSITQKMILHMDITRWSILKSDWLHSLQP